MDNPIKDGWLTTKQAEDLSGYARNHLHRLVKEKKVVAVKVGGLFFFYEPSLRAYMESVQRHIRE